MERLLLPSKRSRNCSLVPSENEDINVNLPDVENVSDVDSETESADAFAADQGSYGHEKPGKVMEF